MVGTKIRRLTKCSMEYKTILALKFVHSKFFIHSIAHRPVAPNASVTILFYSKVPCDTRRALVSGRLCILYFGSGSRRLSYIYLSTLRAASPEDADSNLFPFLLPVGGFSTKSDANMNFFQTVLQSIENPEHAGSPQDLHGLLNLAQLVPGVQGAEQQMQPILGVLGSHLQDALNEQQQNNGQAAVQQTVTNLSQPGAGVQEIVNLFGQDRFNSLIGEISKRTGLDSQLILQFLPALIPVVMKLLATGTHQTNPQAQNPVLNNFLGANQNGGALLTEAFQLASQFLKK
jgi:hypothetical protein